MRKITAILITTGLATFVSAGTVLAGSDSNNSGNMAVTQSQGIRLPIMNPAKGRKLFASKGCVVCHSINGVGGEDAPKLDAKTMPAIMNPFDFAAKMWRGAGTMIAMQEDELGEQIEFTGDELADIIAFVHSRDEQKTFSKADIPPRIVKLMNHMDEADDDHKKKKHGMGKGMMKQN